jgi:hypothetical protein
MSAVITQEMRDEAKRDAILRSVNSPPIELKMPDPVLGIPGDIDTNVKLLQQAVFAEGVRPHQHYVYRPGSTESGPNVYNNFDDLYKMALVNVSADVMTIAVMDDSLQPIVLNKVYDMHLFTLQGYKYSVASHTAVTIGSAGQLINLSGLIGVDLVLNDSMAHTSLRYTSAVGTIRTLKMSYSNVVGLTAANITDNSPCIDIDAGVSFQILLDWGSKMPSIPQMVNVNDPFLPDNGFGYIRLNGSAGPDNTLFIASAVLGSSFRKAVLYANVGTNTVLTFVDSTSDPIDVLSHPANIAFTSSLLAKASDTLYGATSDVVLAPAIPNNVTVKEQMDAMHALQVDNTSYPFHKLVVQNSPAPALLVADTGSNNVDVGVSGSGTTTINSATVDVGVSAGGTTTVKSDVVDIGTSASGTTTVKSNIVDIGTSASGTTTVKSDVVDIGTSASGTTTVKSNTVDIGTSASGTTTVKSNVVDIGTSASGATTVKSGTVNVGDGSSNIGFYGASAIIKPTTSTTAAAFVANTSGIADDSATFGGYTIGQVVAALKNLGLLA